MRRSLYTLAAVFLFLLGPPIFAQSSVGPYTLSANAQCTKPIDTTGLSTLGMQVTGTFTLTIQPEVSLGGQTPANTQVTPSTSSTAQSTITTAGVYSASVAGATNFLLCVTAYTSGTATIYFKGSNLSSRGIGAGGAGSYTFFGNTQNPLTALADPTTIVDAAGNQILFDGATGLFLADSGSDGCLFEPGPPETTECGDARGDAVILGGSNLWQILNSAATASITNPSSNTITVHGATTIDDFASCTGAACASSLTLNQIGNPTATKTFSMGANLLQFSWPGTSIGSEAFVELTNSTPAVLGTNQSSPELGFNGQCYGGSGGAEDQWFLQNVLGTGTNPTTTLTFTHVGGCSGATAVSIPNAALTGTPTAPTATNLTNTTQIATTAFVQEGPRVVFSLDCTQATCATSDTTIFTTGSGASGPGQAGQYQFVVSAITNSTFSGVGCISFTFQNSYVTDGPTTITDEQSYSWGSTAGDDAAGGDMASPFWSNASSAIKYSIPAGTCTGGAYSAHLSLVQIR